VAALDVQDTLTVQNALPTVSAAGRGRAALHSENHPEVIADDH
jgi:hypothetical protein